MQPKNRMNITGLARSNCILLLSKKLHNSDTHAYGGPVSQHAARVKFRTSEGRLSMDFIEALAPLLLGRDA